MHHLICLVLERVAFCQFSSQDDLTSMANGYASDLCQLSLIQGGIGLGKSDESV